MENLESKTASTVLETPKEVAIGEEVYLVAPPTFATLIELSRFIPDLPHLESKSSDDILTEALAHAGDSAFIGEMLAIVILGAEGIEPVIKKTGPFGLKKRVTYPQKELGKKINYSLSNKKIFELFIELLKGLDIVFFSEIITFLRGVNLLKKTKS